MTQAGTQDMEVSNVDEFINFVDVSDKVVTENTKDVSKSVDLVPEECYVVETNPDGSNRVVCIIMR